jgi:hypothetical protein
VHPSPFRDLQIPGAHVQRFVPQASGLPIGLLFARSCVVSLAASFNFVNGLERAGTKKRPEGVFACALGRNRTCGLVDRNHTLYPLSYKRKLNCVLGRNRTCDLLDRNQTLYPLSYKDVSPQNKNPRGVPLNMEHFPDYVNKGRFVPLFGDHFQENIPDQGRVVPFEGDGDTGQEGTLRFQAEGRPVLVFEKVERSDVFPGIQLPVRYDPLLGNAAADDARFLLQVHVARYSYQDKGDGHDRAVGDKGVCDDAEQDGRADDIEPSVQFHRFELKGLPDKGKAGRGGFFPDRFRLKVLRLRGSGNMPVALRGMGSGHDRAADRPGVEGHSRVCLTCFNYTTMFTIRSQIGMILKGKIGRDG